MVGVDVHGGRMSVPNPLAPVRRRLEILALVLGGAGGIAIMAAAVRVALDPNPLSAVITVAWAIGFLSLAGQYLVWATRARREVAVPSRAPDDFVDAQGPVAALMRRELRSHRRLQPGLVRWVSRQLGIQRAHGTNRTLWLADNAWKAAQNGYLWGSFCVILGVGALFLAPTLDNPLGVVLAGLIAIASGGAYIYTSTRRTQVLRVLFREQEPPLEPHEEMVTVRGGGDPRVLVTDMERALAELRQNGQPNRTTRGGWRDDATHVQDVASFSGWMFTETQPTPLAPDPPNVVGFLPNAIVTFALGAGLTVLSLLLGPVTTVATAATTLPLVAAGAGWVRDGVLWHSRFRWSSTAVFIEAEGSSGRTETRVGGALDDTFASTNITRRSDGQYRIYAGALETESVSIDGGRELVGVRTTEESRRAADLILQVLQSFETHGVRLRTVDVEHGAATFVRANAAAARAKADAAGRAPAMVPLDGRPTPAVPQLEGPIRRFSEDARRFCTSCGTPAATESRFCGGCGTPLQVPQSRG